MRLEERVAELELRVEELEAKVRYHRDVMRPYEARRIHESIKSAQALIDILNLPMGKK